MKMFSPVFSENEKLIHSARPFPETSKMRPKTGGAQHLARRNMSIGIRGSIESISQKKTQVIRFQNGKPVNQNLYSIGMQSTNAKSPTSFNRNPFYSPSSKFKTLSNTLSAGLGGSIPNLAQANPGSPIYLEK